MEAVFVEGYRSPEEALIALKAAAADRGAIGMLNVRTERTTAGRCTASGDAIVVVPIELGRAGRTQLRADRATADETSPTPHKPSSEKPPEATDQSS